MKAKCKRSGETATWPCAARWCPLYHDCLCEYEEAAKHKPTNADRIRGMSDEELARWFTYSICRYAKCGDACPVLSGDDPAGPACVTNILAWLTQPAPEEE